MNGPEPAPHVTHPLLRSIGWVLLAVPLVLAAWVAAMGVVMVLPALPAGLLGTTGYVGLAAAVFVWWGGVPLLLLFATSRHAALNRAVMQVLVFDASWRLVVLGLGRLIGGRPAALSVVPASGFPSLSPWWQAAGWALTGVASLCGVWLFWVLRRRAGARRLAAPPAHA